MNYSVNKSNRLLGNTFIINKLENDTNTLANKATNNTIYEVLPHKKSIEDNINNIKNLLTNSIDLIKTKTNPIPFIVSSNTNLFSLAILFLLIGIILHFFY